MRSITTLALTALTAGAVFGAEPAPIAFEWFEYTGRDAAFEAPVPAGSYQNPILAGFYPDPSICRVGDDYYLINSTFSYYPGIPIFHSRDLVHWSQIGHVIHRPEQLDFHGLGVSRAIFAPAISHHDGVFYVVCTMVDRGGNFVVTATDPAGPWSDPVWLPFEGIDPSIFFDDDDGRAWMVNNGAPEGTPLYDGHRAIWVQEFDYRAKKMIGPRSVIVNGGVDISTKPVWIEGPHIYKRGEWYYLCCAEGGTSVNHSQVILRAKSPTGPYTPWSDNPILTQRDLDGTVPLAVTSTGHADLVIGPDGNWWSVFLACRPYGGHYYTTGRETFLLPVTWTEDGWPRILPHGKRVPYIVEAPAGGVADPGPASAKPAANLPPLTGNFTWRDDFPASINELSPLWIMLRQPKEKWWSLTPQRAKLVLTPRAETLDGSGNPSYLGRRLQHSRFEASTSIDIPADAGVSGGIVIFQNETHHYYFGVRRSNSGAELFVERFNGPARETLATVPFGDGSSVVLRIVGHDAECSFDFARKGSSEWTSVLSGADANILTTQVAGGFVGATVGMHARIEP